MAPHDPSRTFKRRPISDQQKRRELSLLRQAQNRLDAQNRARSLASSVFSLQSPSPHDSVSVLGSASEVEVEMDFESRTIYRSGDMDFHAASKLKSFEARRWFAKQLMLPEWMIDVPEGLRNEWYVFARPSGRRCLVVSSNGTTVSRLRNGSVLHHFPSALPSGSRTNLGSSQSYCILDCIFHELDQTYYVIDMICWRGYSLYDCTAEFRFFWLNSKLVETGACNSPSSYHKYKFCAIPVYDCNLRGLEAAYTGVMPFDKEGLLFYNKFSHYQAGTTPLALAWKDEKCSRYVIDTDSKGMIPSEQQVVLELQADGRLTTSDYPPVAFSSLDRDSMEKLGVHEGNLLRFFVRGDGLSFADGSLVEADLHYLAKMNHRSRVFADSYSKILFQYMARRSPLKIEHLFASVHSPDSFCEVEMAC